MRGLLLVVDVLALLAAFVVAYHARAVLPIFSSPPEGQPALERYLPTIVIHVSSIIVMFFFSQLYHQRRVYSRFDQARQILGVVTIGALLANAMQEFIFKNTDLEIDYPRTLLFYVWFFSVFFAGMGREIYRLLQHQLRYRGIARDNLMIVGTGKIARDIIQRIRGTPELGYDIVGVVHGGEKPKDRILGIPIIGTFEDVPYLIDAYAVEQVIIALPDSQRAEIVELVNLCQRGRIDIKVYPDMFAYMAGDLNVDDLSGMPLLTVRDIALRGWKLSLKRGLDIFGASFGLVFLSPLMLLTALLIRIESSGAIFYTQIRMSLDGRPFRIIKFRSMLVDAEIGGPGWTVEDDPRVTRIGHFIRRTSWDEIPNLINVLIGEMSLVGPRPERPVYVQEFRGSIPRYMDRHREKAGMTGWAQVNGLRGDTSISERTSFDVWYVENWSLWLDIKIILRTLIQIVRRERINAY